MRAPCLNLQHPIEFQLSSHRPKMRLSEAASKPRFALQYCMNPEAFYSLAEHCKMSDGDRAAAAITAGMTLGQVETEHSSCPALLAASARMPEGSEGSEDMHCRWTAMNFADLGIRTCIPMTEACAST